MRSPSAARLRRDSWHRSPFSPRSPPDPRAHRQRRRPARRGARLPLPKRRRPRDRSASPRVQPSPRDRQARRRRSPFHCDLHVLLLPSSGVDLKRASDRCRVVKRGRARPSRSQLDIPPLRRDGPRPTRRGRRRGRRHLARGRGRRVAPPARRTRARARAESGDSRPLGSHGDVLAPPLTDERRASLSVVIPHWPLDEEVEASLRRCLASLPHDCEKLVVVNDGTGFGRNVNRGLRLASGDYVAVAGNDTWVVEGDVYDLCLPQTVTSPLVIGDTPGIAPALEPEGFHGCFWVAPRSVLDRVGLLDERFEHAFYEDDDFVARLHASDIATRQIRSVRVRHVGGLTMLKLGTRARDWLAQNEVVFREKWGWTPLNAGRVAQIKLRPRWPASTPPSSSWSAIRRSCGSTRSGAASGPSSWRSSST